MPTMRRMLSFSHMEGANAHILEMALWQGRVTSDLNQLEVFLQTHLQRGLPAGMKQSCYTLHCMTRLSIGSEPQAFEGILGAFPYQCRNIIVMQHEVLIQSRKSLRTGNFISS